MKIILIIIMMIGVLFCNTNSREKISFGSWSKNNEINVQVLQSFYNVTESRRDASLIKASIFCVAGSIFSAFFVSAIKRNNTARKSVFGSLMSISFAITFGESFGRIPILNSRLIYLKNEIDKVKGR